MPTAYQSAGGPGGRLALWSAARWAALIDILSSDRNCAFRQTGESSERVSSRGAVACFIPEGIGTFAAPCSRKKVIEEKSHRGGGGGGG